MTQTREKRFGIEDCSRFAIANGSEFVRRDLPQVELVRGSRNATGWHAKEFTKRSDIRAVRTDAACVHRQTEIFRLLDAQAGFIQLGEAVTFGGHQAVAARQDPQDEAGDARSIVS